MRCRWVVKLIEGVPWLHSFTMLSAQQSLHEFVHTVVVPCFQTDGPLKGLQNRLLTLLLPRQSSIQTCDVGDEQQSISSGWTLVEGTGQNNKYLAAIRPSKGTQEQPPVECLLCWWRVSPLITLFSLRSSQTSEECGFGQFFLSLSLSAHHHTVEDV